MTTLIMKFGGAAVAAPQRFSEIAKIIIDRRQKFQRVVVVVSAMGKTTDQLIDLAHSVNPRPPQREYDMLISVGERISMSLLAMALCLESQEAVSFTGSQSGIITCQHHSNAQIIDVRPYRIREVLDQGKIAIVAGFQGVSANREITTLGRGGSDTSAVALGVALAAEKIEFFKDVPAVFDQDPKEDAQAKPFNNLSFTEAMKIVQRGAKVLHLRAIQLAAKNGVPLHVRSFAPADQNHPGTMIFNAGQKREPVPIYEE